MKRSFIALTLAAVASAGCVKQEVMGGGSNVAPSLVVEQFLRAANAAAARSGANLDDLRAMGRLFGTSAGPAATEWPRQEMELRMHAIAVELKHQDAEIIGEQMVPGRAAEATRLMVRLKKDDKTYDVPFTLVRYKQDSWLIEQIGIEVITNPR